jgi:hypothetical protein
MPRRLTLAAVVLLLAAQDRAAVGLGAQSGAAVPFAVANVVFEQNATDGDVEVVFEVKGGAEGLGKLTVRGPDGRTVADFTAQSASTLGMRQFRFESPEPRDVRSLKAAYPEGQYEFAGTTASGGHLRGQATLSHSLPAVSSFVRPAAEAKGVAVRGLQIAWQPVGGLAAYIVYIEQDELGVNLSARLPASSTSFTVPDGFLRPGTTYQLGIGTVAGNGNTSYIETSFTTGG